MCRDLLNKLKIHLCIKKINASNQLKMKDGHFNTKFYIRKSKFNGLVVQWIV